MKRLPPPGIGCLELALPTRRPRLQPGCRGAQAQRAAVARALVTTPRLVFADEPVASLDAKGGEEMLQILLGYVRHSSAALVLVTHDNTVVARVDREIRMRDGVVEHEVALK